MVSLSNLICLFTVTTLFPDQHVSLRALFVSLCSSVIILQQNSIIGNVLSNRILQWIGKLSYSAYLIHWPLYVFSRFSLLAIGKSSYHPVHFLFLTLILSLIMKRYFEYPIRYEKSKRRRSFLVFVGLTILLSFIGGFTTNSASSDDTSTSYKELCKPVNRKLEDRFPTTIGGCMAGDLNGTTSKYVFVWNSYVSGIVPAIHLIGLKRRERFLVHHVSTHGFCSSTLTNTLPRSICSEGSMRHWHYLRHIPKGSTIVVCNHWFFPNPTSLTTHIQSLSAELRSQNFSVLFMGEPPGIPLKLRSEMLCLDMAKVLIWKLLRLFSEEKAMFGKSDIRLPPVPERIMEQKTYKSLFPKTNFSVQYVDLLSPVCLPGSNSLCKLPVTPDMKDKDSGYLFDGFHLSTEGGRFYSPIIESVLYGH